MQKTEKEKIEKEGLGEGGRKGENKRKRKRENSSIINRIYQCIFHIRTFRKLFSKEMSTCIEFKLSR